VCERLGGALSDISRVSWRPPMRVLQALWDCLSWSAATFFVVGSRYEVILTDRQWSAIYQYIIMACLLQIALGIYFKLYRGRYNTASFDESLGLATTMAIVAAAVGLVSLVLHAGPEFPRALAVLTPPVALLSMAAGRWSFRAITTTRSPRRENAERILIYGAGNAGTQLIRLLASDSSAPYIPVGLIDDDKAKRHLRVQGVPVVGGRSRLVDAAAERGATTIILAVTAATAEMIKEVSALAEGAALHFLVLPPVTEMVGGRVRLSDIREVDLEDILGRHQIETDLSSIASYLTGRVVLVTGAGGSIGSELARQVHRFGPKELVLLDRDESGLHAVQLSIYGQGLLDTPDMVLADIRDEGALDAIFDAHRPDVVLHAAALKHLPMLEQYPEEGWKTNVIGTLNVLRAAEKYRCSHFVNISTDKAAAPTSVLGQTKRLAEQLTSWFAHNSGRTYLSVRFGNVLGSRGSMLHTFNRQIAAGGPVTVTDPEVTRFFMTIPEACQLTIQAAAIGEPGEVLVLDMGEPVRIVDVARRLIAQSGRDVDIIFTGLRPGEKMTEVLFGANEAGEHRCHPLISHVPVPPLNPSALERLSPAVPQQLRINSSEGVPSSEQRADLSVSAGRRNS
jgi:FlaA1/EpsC-like NDP-sugar epimerase